MWLIVGLGNPGSKYRNNRHNIGFMAVDAIQTHASFSPFRKKFQAEVTEGKLPGSDDKVLLIEPQTYMNVSGPSVQEAASFYKVPLDQIIVLHDDLDLPFGKVKIKKGGGAGGHNGLSSLDQHVGNDYWRVRLGIGHPGQHLPNKADLVTAHVLSDFTSEERVAVDDLLKRIAKSFPVFIGEGHEKFINAVHNA